ncbi:MAG: response regulator transcription factor [Bacteroidetes bacterium]|jgi:DNA-binding response OmpR family regulator|nr:response regulator transcription factor [Bacteroidota bacterium]
MRVLVIEDESKVAAFVKRGLEAEGYSVEIAADGMSGERHARAGSFDLVILDAGLPGKDGFDILRDLRSSQIKIPVLMLTARSTTREIVEGLDLGADDYLTKPFAFDVLLARIRSLQRRHTHLTNILRIADLTLDTVSHKAERGSKTIELTAREYALLETFMKNAGTILTRQQLARLVWGYDFDPGTNVVDVYVNHLRKKIDHGFKQQLLFTKRGKGYVLEVPPPSPSER